MTALDAKVRATGLISYKAVVDHAIENGLQPPSSIELRDDAVRIWVTGNPDKWVDSIHVDGEHARDGVVEGRELVYVDGRLPLLGVKVRLTFSRRVATAAVLRAVTSA